MTETVIPFPAHRSRMAVDRNRLNKALDDLIGAMEHQKSCARDYCGVIKHLGRSINTLGLSFQRHGLTLATLGSNVLVVKEEADKLGRTMAGSCPA